MGSTKRSVRLGMITPSSNTCLEPTTYALLSATTGVTAHFARLPVTRIDLDDTSTGQFSQDAMTTAAAQLRDAEVDVVVWNGTAGSWLGVQQDRELAALLADSTQVPATTSTLAMLRACRVYGVTRLGLATPYLAEVNARIVDAYAAEGVDVTSESHLGLIDNMSFAGVPDADITAQLRTVADDAHAVALLCTNVHGAPLVAGLEDELGLPVLDSVSVTLWEALGLAGAHRPIEGAGTLLRDGFLRAELQQVCERLLDRTGADRTTLRVDVPWHGLHVDLTAAEALRPGVRPIRREGSLDQRRLNTVAWLEARRRNLVQPDFDDDPTPPQALVDVYGVRAQLLGPVEHDGVMTGWLSAHSLSERSWDASDTAAMDDARARAESLLSAAVVPQRAEN